MTAAILVLNLGSSSLKFALFEAAADHPDPLLRGAVERIGQTPRLELKEEDAAKSFGVIPHGASHRELVERLLAWLEGGLENCRIIGAGHRIVHGGRDFAEPVLIDEVVLERLGALAPLAPGHQPENLAGVRAVAAIRPKLPQVACFDTGFHRTQERLAQLFALPREFAAQGILRYGFHGLSYESIAARLPKVAPDRAEGRVIVAHLGHGASLCAMRERRSLATSMGFTALDGLMMGRRPGSLDPGVVLHLLGERRMTLDQVADLLYNQSGLLGVSGLSDDMRDLLASEDSRAREAVALFVYRTVREIGALVAVLGGLDVLVFTAGIGERCAPVRAAIAKGLDWLGVVLDSAANTEDALRISSPGSAVEVLVIPTDEEAVIAAATCRLICSDEWH